MKKKLYHGNCTHLNGQSITDMMETAREVTYSTIIAHTGIRELNDMFGTAPHISKDWSVKFFTGKFEGKKCAIVKHSAIE